MNGRAFKQPRRGGNTGRGGHFDTQANAATGWHNQQSQNLPAMPGQGFPNMPQMPSPPPGMPPMDPNNPMAALLAMQAMGFPVPGMPGFPQDSPPTGQSRTTASNFPPVTKKRQRCRDYDQKGFCARGNTCMFEHGNDSIYVPSATDGTYSPTRYLLSTYYVQNTTQPIHHS